MSSLTYPQYFLTNNQNHYFSFFKIHCFSMQFLTSLPPLFSFFFFFAKSITESCYITITITFRRKIISSNTLKTRNFQPFPSKKPSFKITITLSLSNLLIFTNEEINLSNIFHPQSSTFLPRYPIKFPSLSLSFRPPSFPMFNTSTRSTGCAKGKDD